MAKHRQKRKRHDNVEYLQLSNGIKQDKKSWSIHDLKHIKPLTPNQELCFHSWFNNQNLYMHGFPGTGKSYLGIWFSLNEILNRRQDKIILIKSVVPSRSIGFTPGTIADKYAPYESAYHSIFADLIGRDNTYNDMKKRGLVEFRSTSILRGETWDNSIILIDESQNLNKVEFDLVFGRVGKGSRVIVCGDGVVQNDLITSRGAAQTYFFDSVKLTEKMGSFDVIKFDIQDIVRSGFVKEWIEVEYGTG